MGNLFNKIDGFAIVTGGARGLGEAMVLQLASEGYDVVINHVSDRSAPIAQAVADRCRDEFGVGAVTVQADVADYAQCKKIVDAGVDAFGEKIAVMINNAGIQSGKLFHELEPDHYAHMIQVELLGTMNCTHLVLPYMQKAKSGCIISIASICAHIGQPTQSDYAAAKAGMYGFTRSIANENAELGIRANTISPGLVRTDMVNSLPEEIVESFRQTIPMKRLGTVEDIAQCMSYIVNAPWLTGQDISPNGGSVMP